MQALEKRKKEQEIQRQELCVSSIEEKRKAVEQTREI
jgi:hypothetical protein